MEGLRVWGPEFDRTRQCRGSRTSEVGWGPVRIKCVSQAHGDPAWQGVGPLNPTVLCWPGRSWASHSSLTWRGSSGLSYSSGGSPEKTLDAGPTSACGRWILELDLNNKENVILPCS